MQPRGGYAFTVNMLYGDVWGGVPGVTSPYTWPVRTGQVEGVAKVWQTGQKISYYAGDDGDLRAGVPWPSPRFTDHGNGTVTDNLTGIMWTKDANTPGPAICSPGGQKNWQTSHDYIVCLNQAAYLGHSDWRIPNQLELESLFDRSRFNPALPAGHPFTNVQPGYLEQYLSSTVYANNPLYHLSVFINQGYDYTPTSGAYVLPARAGR